VANPQGKRCHCIYGVAAIFNCHPFCGYAPNTFGTLPVPLRHTAKEPSYPGIVTKRRFTPTTTTFLLMPV